VLDAHPMQHVLAGRILQHQFQRGVNVSEVELFDIHALKVLVAVAVGALGVGTQRSDDGVDALGGEQHHVLLGGNVVPGAGDLGVAEVVRAGQRAVAAGDLVGGHAEIVIHVVLAPC